MTSKIIRGSARAIWKHVESTRVIYPKITWIGMWLMVNRIPLWNNLCWMWIYMNQRFDCDIDVNTPIPKKIMHVWMWLFTNFHKFEGQLKINCLKGQLRINSPIILGKPIGWLCDQLLGLKISIKKE